MTLAARRRTAVLVPWLALAAVTAFAIVQMRARHADRGPVSVEESAVPVAPAPEVPRPDASSAAQAAEEALDAALLDLEAARADAQRWKREGLEAAARAEGAEARLAAATARVEALEGELAAREERAEAPVPTVADETPEEPPAEAVPAEERSAEVAAWVEDAASDDPARRRRATDLAASATPEQIEALRRAAGHPVARARLAAHLPAGDPTDDVVIALLGAADDLGTAGAVVATLGARSLLRPAVLEALLGGASPGVLKVALGELSGYATELGDEDRRRELAVTLAPRLARDDPRELHAAARAAGLLRLPGLARTLAQRLDHPEGAVRIAAAHALSLVPDRGEVRDAAVQALPRLLLDDSVSVRTAGALLAEALLGAPTDYDPAAGEGARREAVDRILDRLD